MKLPQFGETYLQNLQPFFFTWLIKLKEHTKITGVKLVFKNELHTFLMQYPF